MSDYHSIGVNTLYTHFLDTYLALDYPTVSVLRLVLKIHLEGKPSKTQVCLYQAVNRTGQWAKREDFTTGTLLSHIALRRNCVNFTSLFLILKIISKTVIY